MASHTSERGQQRRDAMRARILAAARRLFASQGYESTTMQQVVQAAETSIGNLYFYFPNKEALLLALGEEVNCSIGQAIEAAAARVPPGPAQVAAGIYAAARAVLARSDLSRLMLEGTAHLELRASCQAYQAARVERFFEAHPELCRGASPALMSQAWLGSFHRVIEHVISGRLPGDPDRIARFLARWNLQALGLPPDRVEEALAALDHLPPDCCT